MYICKRNILKINMKRNIIILVFAITTAAIIFNSCKKDSTNIELSNPDPTTAMMTLAAIGYPNDGGTPTEIASTIDNFLNQDKLATNGDWNRVWGPGISSDNENMIYVVKNEKSIVPEYAIAIRGTNLSSIFDIIEDLDVFDMVQFPTGQTGDMVAYGALDGFNFLTATTDLNNDTLTLLKFLTSLPQISNTTLYVTGHSQGGSLVPLISYWLNNHEDFKDKFIILSYVFAGPSVVNESFKTNFYSATQGETTYHSFVNTLDVMPYYWSNLLEINSKNIPVHVPKDLRKHIDSANTKLENKGLKYYKIATAKPIGNIPIDSSARIPINDTIFNIPIIDTITIYPSDTTLWYFYWMEREHNYNNYLKLLGAEPVVK